MRKIISLFAIAALLMPALAAAQLVSPLNPVTGGGGGDGHPWYWSPPTLADFDLTGGTIDTDFVPTEDADLGLVFRSNYGDDDTSTRDYRWACVNDADLKTKDWSVTTHVRSINAANGDSWIGVMGRDTATPLITMWGINSDAFFAENRFFTGTGYTDGSVSPFEVAGAGGNGDLFIRINYTQASGGQTDVLISKDGKNWWTFKNNADTEYDQICIGYAGYYRLSSTNIDPVAIFDMWQTTGL